MEQNTLKDEAISIVEDLANWSLKYPKGRVYSFNQKPNIDGELEELEKRAKEFLNKIKKG